MNGKAQYLLSPHLQEQLPIFFQSWWLDIVCEDWDMITVVEGEKVKAVFPVCIDKKMGLKIVRNPLLTPYLGPFFIEPLNEKEIDQTFQQLWAQLPKWDSFDMETTLSFQDEFLLKEKGFDIKLKDTYVLNLAKDEAALFSGINSNHRNLIRQARAVHNIDHSLKHLPTLISLHKETFSRKKMPYPFQENNIKSLIEKSIERGHGQLFAAVDAQQNTTACIFTVWDKNSMYLLLSTVNATDAHPGAVRMLIWEAIKKAKALNISFFDFEGSMDAGIAAFFRRFGGEKKTYICASKTTSVFWKLKKQFLG
jgi:lipid II:glycine glycyltransferase (peptidoglycan interpeptide bridge formation enzyme)